MSGTDDAGGDEPAVPEGYDGEAPGWTRDPANADTTWVEQPPTAPAPAAPTAVPDADTARLGYQPTWADPSVPPPPPPAAAAATASGWGAPSPGWAPPPAPPAHPPAVPGVAPSWAPPPMPGAAPAYYAPGAGLPGVVGWGAVPLAPKPGVIPLRPLGIGEILDGAISYIRRDPKTVLGISAIIASAIALLQMGLYASFATVFDRLLTDPAITNPGPSTGEPDLSGLTNGLGALGGVAFVVIVISFLLNVLATGMLTTAMGRAVLGRPVSTSDVWTRARRRFWPLLGLTLLVGLVVGLTATVGLALAVGLGLLLGQVNVGLGVLVGLALGLVAMLATVWLSVTLLLAPVALVLEDVGVTTSMRRSVRLVRGAWWRTFGIYLLATIIAYVVAQVLTVPFSLAGTVVGTVGSSGDIANPFTLATSIAGALGTLVSQTVVIPFTAGIVALLYIDRRIRREALDIELARAAGAPGA